MTDKIPDHVVIIPNGNRTWARSKKLKPWEAYWIVLDKMDKLIDAAQKLKLKHLTFWGFSTENWKRNSDEVEQLMKVFNKALDQFEIIFMKEEVRFQHLGRKDRLPQKLLKKIDKIEEKTSKFLDRSVNIAFDYGGRDEIIRAINQIIKEGKKEITEEEFDQYLDTRDIPDPDLVIRTAGEMRLSGMMPWQTTYAEYYFTEKLFPEFGADDLRIAIEDYIGRKRTFGGDGKKKEIEKDNIKRNLHKEYELD